MSRQNIPMVDGTLLVIGWDNPFQTWYAMHYDGQDINAAPRAVIGYAPAEQGLLRSERPDAIIGPYPVNEAVELMKLIPELFGIEADDEQPPCWYCKQATWESNPDCPDHPYDRLRYR